MALTILWFLLLVVGAHALGVIESSYDYSATVECLDEPLRPHYDGGIIRNADFEEDLGDEWHAFGEGKVETRKSKTGNTYIVAYDRMFSFDSFALSFHIQKDLLYTFSAWLQLDEGEQIVSSYIGNYTHKTIIGTIDAKAGCWTMLKGGFSMEFDLDAMLFFKTKNASSEIWMDNASLKSFSLNEWSDHREQSIEQVRKRKIRIHVTHEGEKLEGATVKIDQTRPHFTIGGATTAAILTNKAYENWFAARFSAVTFDNEMKWYFTQPSPTDENFTVSDAMFELFINHNIGIRGHNILWNSPNVTQFWVKILPKEEILKAAVSHMVAVTRRYSGDVIAWDVLNENIHFDFYDRILGPNASAIIYQIVHALDPNTPLFLNEFNTLESPADWSLTPHRYVEKIKQIRSYPGNEKIDLKIGIEGHFLLKPNVSHMRASLDILAAANASIWITELDTRPGPTQAAELEDVMREAFSHPAVEGIIIWGGWKPTNCDDECLNVKKINATAEDMKCATMCLIDENVENLAPGDVVDKLIGEWRTVNATGVTDADGVYEESVFMGEYNITCSHPLISGVGNFTIYVAGDYNPMDIEIPL